MILQCVMLNVAISKKPFFLRYRMENVVPKRKIGTQSYERTQLLKIRLAHIVIQLRERIDEAYGVIFWKKLLARA